MKKNGFLNLVLVLSFLISNISAIPANQNAYTAPRDSWNLKAVFGNMGSWLEGLRVASLATEQMRETQDYPTSTPAIGPVTTDTPTPSIDPTSWVQPTQTASPTPTETTWLSPTPSIDPTEWVQPTQTASPTPTETSWFTETPTIEPSQTPSWVPTSTITATTTPLPGPDTLPITMTFSAYPELVYPGGVISFTWKISNWEEIAPWKPILRLTFPKGFELEGEQVIPLNEPTGGLKSMVLDEARGPFEVSAELRTMDKSILLIRRTYEEGNRSVIGPKGGTAIGLNGNVQVYFPPEALEGVTLDNPLIVRIRPPISSNQIPYYLSDMPFEIVAEQQPDGPDSPPIPVTQFKIPVEISIFYTDEQVKGIDEPALFVNYYNEREGDWEPIQSRVDTEANILKAWVDHFSVFDVNTQNWEAARLPSLQGFQVASFTGAATYSFPIQVPPGPGGLQPGLSLSYNSMLVDNASGNTQAAWVGMGWSLDTGYIQRNMHGTMTWLEDDTYSLTANGSGGMMLKGTDGYYHTTHESFWRIEYFPPTTGHPGTDYWIAWDKTGNQYYYGYEDSDRAHYPNFDPELCGTSDIGDPVTWRWELSKIRNIFGQELIFNYNVISKWVYSDPCGPDEQFGADIDIYPSEIIYPNWHYRVLFTVAEDRTDLEHKWTLIHSYTFYQKARLTSITIQHDADGNHDFSNAETIRRYDLIYASGSEVIFPNYVWNEGGKTLTLKEIREYGYLGAGPLPATIFTYADGMHLTKAVNGYGGRVEFNYESWSDTDAADGVTIKQSFGGQGQPCYDPGDQGGWSPAECGDAGGPLIIGGTAYKGIDPAMLHPGGLYELYAKTKSNFSTQTLYVGLKDGSTEYLLPAAGQPIYTWGWTELTVKVLLPATSAANYSKYVIKIVGISNSSTDTFSVKWLPTYYRVVSKTVYDEVTGESHTNTYQYDEPATNDATHSVAVANTDPYWRYTDAYTESRGYAMIREIDPVGRVTTTFYDQGDARAGGANIEIVGTNSFVDDFSGSTLNTGNWYVVPGANPQITSLRGDTAVQLPGGVGSFLTIQRQGYTVTDGMSALMQFQSSGSSNEINLGVESGTGGNYLSLGISVQANGSVRKRSCAGGNCEINTEIMTASNFHRDTWYVFMIIVDDQQFYLRLWERDNPINAGRAVQSMGAGISWHSFAQAKNGTLWLDTYSEGLLYTLNMYFYDADSNAPISADQTALPRAAIHPHPYNTELTIYWSRLFETYSLDFGGDAGFIGKDIYYDYNIDDQGGVQYGNLTRIQYSYHNGSAWVAYRGSKTVYYPYVLNGNDQNSRYLVGLPGYTNTFQCPSGCDWAVEDLLTSHWYLYDNQNMFNVSPTNGKLTGERSLVDLANLMYTDTSYAYDAWGNRTTVTLYTGTTGINSFGSGSGAQASYTCYGGGGYLNGYACTSDGYGTYLAWERNALNQLTTLTYDKTKSVPTSLTDPNNITTSATYDNYGRLLTIIRPGDDPTNQTIRISYHEASSPFLNNPFWTEVQQRISGSTYFKIRKYYNGLGQLLQTQVVGATIGTQPRDILADTFYDAGGRVYRQTVPYDVATGSNYHVRSTSAAYTQTSYDVLGRTTETRATDETPISYTYSDGYASSVPYLETTVTNARGYATTTRSDIWGRVVKVTPPAGPSVAYTYDAADKLLTVVRGGSTTTLTYDFGGRKINMSDPDMGAWIYTYDALGNLKTQTDARGCITTLAYDPLNRLTGKTYSGACSGTAVAYTYDSGTNGKGRRTGMSDGSGSTIWTYDSRGRMTQEIKVINNPGGGTWTFKTQWGFNSADLVSTMTYPADASGNAGEVVTFNYLNQMLLDTVIGTNTYVYNTDYDAAGRVDLRNLGADVLRTDYVYYAWNTQGGRLQYQKTGTPSNATSMQYFTYTYDENGNVKTILDAKNSSQKQCFLYDSLDRLTRGTTQLSDAFCQATHIGNGQYDESYVYDGTSGNLSSKGGQALSYGDTNHKHAATTWNGWTYTYDANGNMQTRTYGGTTYTLTYDAENHLTGMTGGSVNASFTYDGDGNRVKGFIGGVTTAYVGNHAEWISGSPGTLVKYYYAGATRVAMRSGSNNPLWLLGDHLGSTSKVANYNGLSEHSQQMYKPWGEKRYPTGAPTLPTTFRYTGQRSETGLGPSGGEGLYFYNARWYDSSLGRFIQADTIIPGAGNPQAYDRYAYSYNNPVKYIDPTGHSIGLPPVNIDPCQLNPEFCQELLNDDFTLSNQESNNDPLSQTTNVEYSFPDQPDYRSLSMYFGQFGSLLELLLAQLEPTPFTELLAPAAGQLLSGGFTITKDKYGRIYISPGASLGRTLVSYPLLGIPAISYTYGYIERGGKIGPEGNGSREELDNLLKGGGRSHGFCGPIFPCINRIYSLTSPVSAWEWGFGIPQINFISLFVGLKP